MEWVQGSYGQVSHLKRTLRDLIRIDQSVVEKQIPKGRRPVEGVRVSLLAEEGDPRAETAVLIEILVPVGRGSKRMATISSTQ